eukprot:SM000098S25088  [mRNA]  locus=s98:181533:184867:- [translate_table: standard]
MQGLPPLLTDCTACSQILSTIPGAGRVSSSSGLPTRGNGDAVSQITWQSRFSWLAPHLLIILIAGYSDTWLSHAILCGDLWLLLPYSIVVFITIAVYVITAGSSPGYVQEIQEALQAENARTNPTLSPLGRQTSLVVSKPDGYLLRAGEDRLSAPTLSSTDELSSGGSLNTSSTANEEDSQPPTESGPSERTPLLASSVGKNKDQPVNKHLQSHMNGSLRRIDSNRRCPYCEPFRTKHCHDCDKCVLKFDHHCFWVGTCVGQRNHCRFWWYLFFETMLVTWTFVIQLSALHWKHSFNWWTIRNILALVNLVLLFAIGSFLIILLFFHSYLAVTNQTTYERTRKKRIAYLRTVPDGVHPFSKGCWTNLHIFCLTSSNVYPVYEMPTMSEMEARAAKGGSCWSCSDCC